MVVLNVKVNLSTLDEKIGEKKSKTATEDELESEDFSLPSFYSPRRGENSISFPPPMAKYFCQSLSQYKSLESQICCLALSLLNRLWSLKGVQKFA